MAGSDSDLESALRASLSTTFMFYVEAHIFHWNVTGPRFSQLHAFFGEIYEDAFEAVDALAEHLRTLDVPAPETSGELFDPSAVRIEQPVQDADGMVAKLDADNNIVMTVLKNAQEAAEEAEEVGVANFLQDRIDRHAKWGWMLRSTEEPVVSRPDRRYRRA
jgi:starvation-inducible DNA-binding protein